MKTESWSIMSDENYCGQIVNKIKIQGYEKEKTNRLMLSKREFVPFPNFDFYSHQVEFFNKIKEEKNVILQAPFNSGRSTIVFISSLYLVFNKRKSVLFITKSKREKYLLSEEFKNFLKEIYFNWLIEIKDLSNINEKIIFPDIYIADLEDLNYCFIEKRNNLRGLFETLQLVVVDNFNKFSGEPASNLHYILKRLKNLKTMYSNDCLQYAVISSMFYNSFSIIKEIFENEFEIVNKDGKDVNSKTVFIYVPKLSNIDFKRLNEKSFELTLIRESISSEVMYLSISAIEQNKNVVIFYSGLPFGEQDKESREREINDRKKKTKDYGKWFLGNDLDELSLQLKKENMDWKDIEVIIVVGFQGGLSDLKEMFLHIGADNSQVYVVVPQLPYYQYFINHPEELGTVKTISEISERKIFSLFLYELYDNDLILKHNIFSVKETERLLVSEIDEEATKFFLKDGNRYKLSEKGERIFNYLKQLSGKDVYSLGIDIFSVYKENDNKLLTTVDKERIIIEFFPGAILYLNNRRYLVKEINFLEKKILVSEEEGFTLSFPIISEENFKIESEHTLSKRIFNNKVSFELKKAEVSIKFDSYKKSKTLDVNRFNIISFDDGINLSFFSKVLVINPDFSEESHSFAHLLFSAMRTLIKFEDHNFPVLFLTKGSEIYFIGMGITGAKIFDFFDIALEEVFERMYSILIDCPCQKGCPGCLQIIECPSCGDEQEFSKKRLIEYLGKMLMKTNYYDELRWKFEKINENVKLKELVEKAIRILEVKSEMQFNLDEIDFSILPENQIAQNVRGITCGNSIKIKPFCESVMYDIVAHELTHVWQNNNIDDNTRKILTYFNYKNINDQKNIPFAGHLLIEGHAVWMSLKVIDYFGIKKRFLENSIEHYAEYKVGAILMQYLESKYGLSFIKRFFDNNNGVDKNSEENKEKVYEIKNWMKDSNVGQMIKDEGKNLIKNGYLLCLDYLGKFDDIDRISYFMHIFLKENLKGQKLNKIITSSNDSDKIKKIKDVLKIEKFPCLGCKFFNKATLSTISLMIAGDISKESEIIKKIGGKND